MVFADQPLVFFGYNVEVAQPAAFIDTEKGFDAASLKGGYISWLLDAMKEDEVAESGTCQ